MAVTLIILMVCSLCAFSQQPIALRQIIPGHYVFTSMTYNSGIIATSEGVLVLDALNSEPVGRAERKAIEDTIRQPVRVLVSSTFHDNYSKGNLAYGCLEDRTRELPDRSPHIDAAAEGIRRRTESEASESD